MAKLKINWAKLAIEIIRVIIAAISGAAGSSVL
jgi:hypothetical protein